MMARAFCARVAVALAVLLCGPVAAHAQRGARTSVNRIASANIERSANFNLNVNSNVNVNRNADVDVDRGVWGGYGGCCYHTGVGTAAAVATSAAVTAAVVGTRVNTLAVGCTAVVAGGVTYQQCGSVWYQPQFVGTGTTYVVVNAPY
jgi:hypothetical protein